MTAQTVRIGYLHHSTGEAVWNGGVRAFVEAWNAARRTDYRITRVTYPATTGGWPPVLHRLAPNKYPWANYPYDYWNLWVKHTGRDRDRGELNLDDLTERYDVIVFKHCFPVSRVKPDDGAASVSSSQKTIANYRLQYEALKARLRQFPTKRFIVWTGAALPEAATNAEEGARARQFFEWVKRTWDEKGDNIFVWDFHELETEGGLFLKPEYCAKPRDAHPSATFAKQVAPLVGQRIVDVIEGRGDDASLTGETARDPAAAPSVRRSASPGAEAAR
jgi:hypothetical protein